MECDSLVGNSTCMCQADGVWSRSYSSESNLPVYKYSLQSLCLLFSHLHLNTYTPRHRLATHGMYCTQCIHSVPKPQHHTSPPPPLALTAHTRHSHLYVLHVVGIKYESSYQSSFWGLIKKSMHWKNKLVVLTMEWLPWFQSWVGYVRFLLVLET